MLFNSFTFLVFLVIVFTLYWFVLKRSIKLQNTLLLVSSYIFYGWWDWRFLFLLIYSSLLDYAMGLLIDTTRDHRKKKLAVVISLTANLGLLGFFKYYNFFVGSLVDAFGSMGISLNARTLEIILPVGLSFYTFQSLSYIIDVYRGTMKATRDIISFLAYVSFFPQLVAGPIERAINLLPQFQKPRIFRYEDGVTGLRLILWGLFKKIVIADGVSPFVNDIFSNYQNYSGSVLVLGAVLFGLQIYGDFSGYSDIAIGTARLFGFKLMRNFNYPYFSRTLVEFWRRWHISLSTWFRDYIYFPLGGNKRGKAITIRNIFIVFLVSGLWHGANWTFVAWGAIHALFFAFFLIFLNRSKLDDAGLYSLRSMAGIVVTYAIVTFSWIFFRAESITHAFAYIQRMVDPATFTGIPFEIPVGLLVILILFMVIEWIGQDVEVPVIPRLTWIRRLAYILMVYLILYSFNYHKPSEFIYFQF